MADSTNSAPLRLGIMSTATLSFKDVQAMKAAKGITPVCIASRELERAQTLAEQYGIPRAVGSYAALLDDDDVDAVYVPLPTVLHLEWVSQSIAAGKHVLCEKPLARSAQQLHRMLQQSRALGVAFMDGGHFEHHPRTALLQKVVDERAIGAAGVRSVHSVLTFRGDAAFFADNASLGPDADPLGCLGDLGWHSVRLALWAFGYELPTEVRGVVHAEQQIPLTFSGTLQWAPDTYTADPPAALGVGAARTATFFCSFTHAPQQTAVLAGDDGFIELDDFVVPKDAHRAAFRVVREVLVDSDKRVDRTASEHTAPLDTPEAALMWEAFAEVAWDPGRRPAVLRRCLVTQLCIDALLESSRNNGRPVKPDPENLLSAYLEQP